MTALPAHHALSTAILFKRPRKALHFFIAIRLAYSDDTNLFLETTVKQISMINWIYRTVVIMAVLAFVSKASPYVNRKMFGEREPNPETDTVGNEEYIRHIHSMINAYREDLTGGRLVIETKELIDMKFRMWKRNADLINSLLGLPKGMNDAGR